MAQEDDDEVIRPVFDFNVFKRQFALALKQTNGVCISFHEKVSKAEGMAEIEKLFKQNKEQIADWLGFDTDPDCDNCSREERRADDLANELEQYKDLQQSVADEYKLKAFIQHRDSYSAEELEALFYNGKTLLEMMNKK